MQKRKHWIQQRIKETKKKVTKDERKEKETKKNGTEKKGRK